MKINHVAMYCADLDSARDFFIRYFEAISGEKYFNPVTEFSSYFLSFEDGSRLELMHKPYLAEREEACERLGYAHIAFSVGSTERVDSLTERLKTDGYNVVSGPRVTGDGYYESCVIAFEGNMIEITV